MKRAQLVSLAASILLLICVTITLFGHRIDMPVWLSVVPLILFPIIVILYVIAIVRIVKSKKK